MTETDRTGAPEYDPPYVRCPLCQSTKVVPHHRDCRGNRISRCHDCSVQFMNPVYSDMHLSRYYAQYQGTAEADDSVLSRQRTTNRIKLRTIGKFIRPPGRLLDFGCGNGNFIAAALSEGWDAYGYDVDCESTRRAVSRLGVDIACGDLQNIGWPPASFDLIHAHHVVEHLKYPVADLRKLNHWLRPGGYIYVAVPNIESLAIRVKFQLEKLGLRQKNVGRYYDSDHHVFYYSPSSMRHLFERTGFEVLLKMTGNKPDIGDNRWTQLFSYTLRSHLYAGSAFFVIGRKVRDTAQESAATIETESGAVPRRA